MAYPRDPNYGMPANPQEQGYRFTPEEVRVMRECNRESFYQRCVPLMTIITTGTYYATKTGLLKPSMSPYGSLPRIGAGIVLGFILGKLSYKNKCEEKILALPGGKLKEAILQSRRGLSFGSSPYVEPAPETPFVSARSDYSYSDRQKSISELDTDRTTNLIDDPFSNQDHNSEKYNFPPVSPSQSMTYDDLRRRNRDEYETQRSRQYRGPERFNDIPTYSAPISTPAVQNPEDSFTTDSIPAATQAFLDQPAPHISEKRSWNARQNQYGDVWDK